MANGADLSLGAQFDEGALILDSPECVSLPEAGRTPTTPAQGVDLAAAVDGAMGTCIVTVHLARGYMFPL